MLSPDVFEGARFEFNKTLTSKFALLHNVALAGGQAGSYEFGAHFGDESTLLASRIDMQGRLNGRLNAQLTGAPSLFIRTDPPAFFETCCHSRRAYFSSLLALADALLLRLQAQVAPESAGTANSFRRTSTTRAPPSASAATSWAGGLLGGSYLQSVTHNLALGAEGFYHSLNKKVRGGALAARYVWGPKGENVGTAKVGTFGNGAVELAYQRKVSEKVALATELQYYHNQFCSFGVGYEFKLRAAVFKGPNLVGHDVHGRARGAHPAGH